MFKEKRLSGQALAIVMVVLVVAVIIGMAMLSRTLSDQERVTEEKASAEALEFTDAVLDVVKGTTAQTLDEVCQDGQYGSILDGEGCKIEGFENVENYLGAVGVSDSVLDGFDTCQAGGSELEMSMDLADFNDVLEVRPGKTRAFVVSGQTPDPAGCMLRMKFEPRGGSNIGVEISNVYAKNYTDGMPGEYKPYDYDDTSAYCLASDEEVCPDGSVLSGEWDQLSPDTVLEVPLSGSGGYSLDEIRVRPVNGVVGMQSELSSPDCLENMEMVKVVVAATCSGSYRAKTVQIPQQEWAMPIFDYVLFNGSGVLQSE